MKRCTFTVFSFPGKFLLSYYTAMVYTNCYQCNAPELLKQDSKQELSLLNSFHEKDSPLLFSAFLENSFCLIIQQWFILTVINATLLNCLKQDPKQELSLLNSFHKKDSLLLFSAFLEKSFCLIIQKWFILKKKKV